MKPTAEYHLPASFTPQLQQEMFEETVLLYDLADKVLATIAAEDPAHQKEQMALVTPFITQVTNSANILSAFYTEVVRNNRPVTPDLQDTFEQAFQNIFSAYKDFLESIKSKYLPEEG